MTVCGVASGDCCVRGASVFPLNARGSRLRVPVKQR